MEENCLTPLTESEAGRAGAWMDMIEAWTEDPEIGLRFMVHLHRAVLNTYSDMLGTHATLQSALMLVALEEAGTYIASTSTDGKDSPDARR